MSFEVSSASRCPKDLAVMQLQNLVLSNTPSVQGSSSRAFSLTLHFSTQLRGLQWSGRNTAWPYFDVILR